MSGETINIILDELINKNGINKLANDLNISTGTIKRWKDLCHVPKQYLFQLMKLNRNKNSLSYCNHTIDEARVIISEI